MTRAFCLITIDTEGDDLWTWHYPRAIRTDNARYLGRFQALCESFGLKPTYLTNYEMTVDRVFQAFARSVLERHTGEIGLHVHAWNSPPLTGRAEWDFHQSYITDLPERFIRQKMERLTVLLEETLGIRPVSHRAGRYGFDERVARVLVDLGFEIDCSVTPGISWKRYAGAPDGAGGMDFRGCPLLPYLMDLSDVARAGSSGLLEVPVTIRPNHPRAVSILTERFPVVRHLAAVYRSPHSWLRPNGSNLEEMKSVVDWALGNDPPVLEFILHSSELMPGGSPNFVTTEDIERLYVQMERLFEHIADLGVTGATLTEYRQEWLRTEISRVPSLQAASVTKRT